MVALVFLVMVLIGLLILLHHLPLSLPAAVSGVLFILAVVYGLAGLAAPWVYAKVRGRRRR